jgi:DNA modification methylase
MEKLEWRTEKRKVKDLQFYKYNPRTIQEARKSILKKGITAFNLVEIPAIDVGNVIIAGNQRIAVLLSLGRGEEEIDVRVPNRKLTEEEFKEYNLRSNVSIGDWDWDILKNYSQDELLQVGIPEIDLSKNWENELSVEDDHFNVAKALEDVKTNPTAKTGDLYHLGTHKLICGDALDPSTFKRLAGDIKVSYINCDPPFNIKLDYSKGIGNASNYGGQEKDKRTDDEYKLFLKTAIQNCLSVAGPDSHFFYWCDEKYVFLLQELYKVLSIENKRLCIWIKNNQSATPRNAFNKMTEYCVYGSRGKPYLNDMLRNLNEIMNKEVSSGNRAHDDIMDMLNIWLVDRLPSSEYQHPTMKPPQLYEKAMRRCTKIGDYILDCFGGSGSQLIAAEQLKRKALLVEKDPTFVDLILLRYEQLTGIKPVKIS